MASELTFFPKDEETRVRTYRKNKNALTVDRTTFFTDLLKFHESRGTPIIKFPKIAGNGSNPEVDLYKLYESVTGKGGWMKVNSKNEWSEIEKEIGFPEKCVNSELALKHIYIRYFDKYERYNFLGEEKERIDEDEEESRHKRWSARALHSIPSSYNYGHHNISDMTRVNAKLSTDLYQSSEYDKLSLSLISPLPNEQDFAINVLTLMSNECKQTLRLGKCPRLISILLCHAGVYEQYNMREMFREYYSTVRGHSHDHFWNDLLHEKPDLTDLLYEDGLTDENIFLDAEKLKEMFSERDKLNKEMEEFPFLCLGRGLGTQDYIGQRVHQVAAVIRNLSFFEENIAILARNRTLTRFLVLTANIRWNNLHMSALDVLGNIAGNLELNDPFADVTSRHLFGTVCDGIEGNDRAVVISSMEILSKLCVSDANEEFLLRYLKKSNYERVCLFLLVQDMMLLIYTLECIYSLTSLGEKACNAIVDIHGVLDTLVSMVTIEAQSLGPDSCIQMKVVETVPARMMQQPQQRQMVQQGIIQRTGNIPDQQRAMAYQSPTKFTQPTMDSPSRADQLMKQNQQQMIQENEQFALAWLRNNFELSPSLMVKIEEQDLYKMYVNACTKVGRKGALSQVHFPRCARSVFGGSVGPNPGNSDSGERPPMYYCGIKPRATMMQQPPEQQKEMIVIHPPKSSSPATPMKTEESALVAQLSGKQTTTTSLLQQVLSTNQQVSSTQSPSITSSAQLVSTPTTTTSLIKSLLANKVTTGGSSDTNMPTATVSMNSSCVVSANVNSLHQVAQRQFTQKQKQLSEQLSTTPIPGSKLMVSGSPAVNSLKIGNSTLSIKPAIETKQVVVTTNDPPPLAPLSIQSNKAGMKQTITLTPNTQDGKVLVSPSQKIVANKMLVDLLDKKAPEPPVFGTTTIKRKIDMDSEVPAKKADTESADQSPSSKAADLYAKLAGSILEDEEMEDELEKSVPAKKVIEVKSGTAGGQQIINSSPRQIIMGPNNQVILSPGASSHQTATIKTDSGIQTVPIILQNNSIQGMPGQQLIQQPAPTQYILATNQQGQTYVVAQQPMPQPQQIPQTVLLAQTPNQQGTQTKTIIILQQNQGQQNQQGMQQIQVNPQGQQQKIIMTPSGQQVIYSQRPYGQQQVLQNYQQGNNIHTTIIQSGTTQSMTNRKIVFTNTVEGQTPGGAKIIQAVQQQQSTQQHTLQALTQQGQNIIMQKGQKFQIGNTQISQVIQPAQQQQQQIQSQPQQVQIVQKQVQQSQVLVREQTSAVVRLIENPDSKSSSPSIMQQEAKAAEEIPITIEEAFEAPKDSPSQIATTSATNSGSSSPAPSQGKQQVSIHIPVPQSQIVGPNSQQYSIKIIPSMDPAKVKDEDVELSWPFVCDWRGCPRKKFANANEVYLHACAVHCPSLEGTPDLFCQWGGGNSLCDNLPRKRFSLMTHIFDRHCTVDAFKMAVQKRLAAAESGTSLGPKQPYPVTLVRHPNVAPPNEAAPNLLNGPTNIQNAGSAAMQAIKRHSIEFNIAKEAMEEPEGTVTKSIRLTAALILRNLVTYSNSAKRALHYHEYHLSQIALSNNESNRVIAQVLYEMNEQISPFCRP